MGWFLIAAIIVGLAIYFKVKSEDSSNTQVDNDEVVQKIKESPLTRHLQAILLDQFGDFNGEEVDKLRRLAAGGGRAGYLLEVQTKGLLFTLFNRKGETLDKWSITFDGLGYEDLPYAATKELQKILLQTLSNISHLMVLDTGFFMYNQNREKQSW